MNESGPGNRRKGDVSPVTSGTSAKWMVLRSLGADERAAFEARLHRRTYAVGQVVFNDGDRGDSLYLVESGRLEVQSTTSSGHSITLRVIHPDEVFGELALVLASNHRLGRVRALETAVVHAMSRRDFDAIRAEYPGIDRFLIEILAAGVVRTSNLVREMLLPPETRVWRRLVVLADAYGDEPIRMTQEALAAAAGTVRQTANRVVNAGVKMGALATGRGSIRVIDRQLAQQMAAAD